MLNLPDEFLRCLLELDAPGIRRLARLTDPKNAPKTDHDALYSMHLARVDLPNIDERRRQYSKDWLAEHGVPRLAHGVGIAVGMASDWQNHRKAERLLNVRGEMEHSVQRSISDGLDLGSDNDEIRRRMMVARERA